MTKRPVVGVGNYRVIRFCCRDGLCCKCHSRGNHGNRAKREIIIHTAGVSRAWANHVAANWVDYGASVQMEPHPPAGVIAVGLDDVAQLHNTLKTILGD